MRIRFLAILPVLFLLSACESVETKAEYPVRRPGDGDTIYTQRGQGGVGNREGMFGSGGLFGLGRDEAKNGAGVGITVNAYLWRAALDTVSFMPIASADPFGGTILTDWYSPPETKNERVKANIIILSRELRSDALKVTVFRQVMSGSTWKDATVTAATQTELENAILTRARQLKVAAAEK